MRTASLRLRSRQKFGGQRGRRTSIIQAVLFFSLACSLQLYGQTIVIQTPNGAKVTVNIPHADPSGSLVKPLPPQSPGFRPPSIFSAPLARGSGARALGLAGAFTAVADDATAASWNPAGLIQLERPEASFMLRETRVDQDHHADSESFSVGEDKFDDGNLNYLSAVYPFRLAERNFVFSLNYQEAYDFNQNIHRRYSVDVFSVPSRYLDAALFTDTDHQHFEDNSEDIIMTMDFFSHLTISQRSTLNQILSQELLSSLDFEQEGIIDAVTPAWAAELTPKLSIGAAVNFYQDSPLPDRRIRSRILAKYSGQSGSRVSITDQSTIWGTYEYNGTLQIPPVGYY